MYSQNLTVQTDSETPLTKQVKQLGNYIGNTPLFRLERINPNKNVRLLAKLEWQQFGGSVKARPAYRIIRDALESGELGTGRNLLDASSGNTGIAYAHIAAALGLGVTLCLPENASGERKRMLRALGVDLRLTSRTGTTDEAQEIARDLKAEQPGRFFLADQYGNPGNWKAHYDTTGEEIWKQTRGAVTHFITGLGTTGTFTGTGRKLKELNPGIRLVSLQPERAMHGLEGWKHLPTANVPGIYDRKLADENRFIDTERAHEVVRETAEKEGLLLSPSSAANLCGALELAGELDEGTVVTVFPDDGSKYGEVMDELFT